MMTMQPSVLRRPGEEGLVDGCEWRGAVGPRDTSLTTHTYTHTNTTTEAPTVPTTATVTRPASGTGGPKRHGPTPMWPTLLCLLAWIWLQPVAAVLVPFDNCLRASYIADPHESSPSQAQLQWVPKYVDAFFDLEHDSHNLRVTMYGNVTGRVGEAQLPLWNDPKWARNDSVLEGKIQNQPDTSGMATTLYTKVEFLSYEPYKMYSSFCNNTKNGTCPLGPVFTPNVTMYDLPSLGLSTNLSSTYAFASLAPTFIVWWGDKQSTSIGCVAAVVTPSLGGIAWFLKFLPAIALLLVGAATLFAAVFSPWGTTNIFHWSSNFGRDPDLLRLVTPGFGDCLQYIQFIALTGGLSLDYPGFYQPAVSNGAWSALMFNESFVSGAAPWQSIVDGIYVTNLVDGVYDGSGIYGLEAIARLVGMSQVQDVWAGMMVWLLVIVLAAVVLTQLGFFLRWLLRYISENPEEDLRAKNLPFTVGNVIRVVFHFFLLPIVTLSTFQLVVAGRSAFFLVALAVVTIVLIIGFAVWLMYLIATTRPRAHLFDDLPTVLLYGPLYNTYSDEAAAFALIPIILTLLRGIALGAVQPSGIAQLVILAVCEVIQMLTLHAFRPFHSSTSMNAYHTGFAALRFITVMLMVAFAPSMGVTEGPKGWIGYAILLIHGAVLVFGFFLNAVQTIVEVIARMYGAGGDDVRGQTRGGLSKIFGARQLQRRISRRGATSRASQISTAAMLNADRTSKRGYGRIRSESAGSMGIHLQQHRSSSILEAGRSVDAFTLPPGSAFTPTTPGEASTFSFLPPPGQATRPQPAADPYYRPPRAKRTNHSEDMGSSPPRVNRGSTGSLDLADRRLSKPMPFPDMADMEGSGRATPAPPQAYAPVFAPRADYSTREVDFYYGVRGPALNSDGPGRRLGTGPADPTSPITTATGWLRGLFGGKTKEKGKGFEVVRSARMPPAMKARGGDFGDDDPPEGIPVAMGVLRNGPIDSDDEDGDGTPTKKGRPGSVAAKGTASGADGDAAADDEAEASSPSHVAKDPPLLPDLDAGESFRFPSRAASSKTNRQPSQRTVREIRLDLEPVPDVPRKSSKRNSSVDKFKNPLLNLVPPEEEPGTGHRTERSDEEQRPPSRLPFDRTNSQKRLSVSSLAATEDLSQATPGSGPVSGDSGDERPTSYGHVPHQSVSSSRFDPSSDQRLDLLGSAAEVVDQRVSPGSSVSAGSRRERRM